MQSPKGDMDLRDWFAGQALMGLLMSPGTPRVGETPIEEHAQSLAEQAYAFADAMLRLRAHSPGESRPK